VWAREISEAYEKGVREYLEKHALSKPSRN